MFVVSCAISVSSLGAGTVSRVSVHGCVLEQVLAEGPRVDGNPAPLCLPNLCSGAGSASPRGHLFLSRRGAYGLCRDPAISRIGPRVAPCNLDSLIEGNIPTAGNQSGSVVQRKMGTS